MTFLIILGAFLLVQIITASALGLPEQFKGLEDLPKKPLAETYYHEGLNDGKTDEMVDIFKSLSDEFKFSDENLDVGEEKNYKKRDITQNSVARNFLSNVKGIPSMPSLPSMPSMPSIPSLWSSQTQAAPNTALALPESDYSLLDMPNIVKNFLKETRDLYNDVGAFLKAITEALTNRSSSSQLLSSPMVSTNKTKEFIRNEIQKVRKVRNFVQETLQKIRDISAAIAKKVKSSECLSNLTDIKGLVSDGINCLKEKFNDGKRIILQLYNNLLKGLKIPNDLMVELKKCDTNQNNTLGRIICYFLTPLQLEKEQILLPVEFIKRILELTHYFSTMKEDLINCGITTIASIT
uniref:37.2 kDa salivary protein n=1 Tax=Lutzomyia longipalpis TaxID=7200 RepID=Q5WPT7_LUTLO|nr:37.2 kDa salivary protein [Lutzomyia longipalpis]